MCQNNLYLLPILRFARLLVVLGCNLCVKPRPFVDEIETIDEPASI